MTDTPGVLTGGYNLGVACADAPASRAPDRIALIQERDGVTETLTFAELAESSTRLAAHLAAEGVRPGDRIGVFASAGNQTAIGHIAALKAGAVAVPLVPLLGDGAIAYRLDDADVACVLTDERHQERLAGIFADHARTRPALLLSEALDAAPVVNGFSPHGTEAHDPAMIIYSSGTTGKPKGAVEPHSIVLGRHAPMAMIHGPFVPEDVFWTPVDWMWIGSFVDSLLAPLSYGCTVLAYDRRKFDGVDAVRRLKEFGVTKAFIPPAALRILIEVPAAEVEGHSMVSIHSGGETLPGEVVAGTREVFGVTVDEIYGMTEASFVAGSAHRFYPQVEGSLGRPYPGQRIVLRTEDGRVAEVGETGEMTVDPSSPSLFLGYFRQPEATAGCYTGGWYGTGDLAARDERGYLFYKGRKDDLIMSSGHRLGPSEIELAIARHAAVKMAVVVGAPDPERGQRIKAVVQLVDGAGSHGSLDELTAELQDLVRTGVGKHAYPREIEYIDEFPRTVTGKVRRDVLRLPRASRGD